MINYVHTEGQPIKKYKQFFPIETKMKKINVFFFLLVMLVCGVSGIKATTVYYDNANSWSNVYCYYYADGVTGNPSWPGTAMTQTTVNGKTWYKLDIPDNFKAGKFIVNDGNGNQYPGANQPSVDLNGKDNVWLSGTSVSYTDGSSSDSGSSSDGGSTSGGSSSGSSSSASGVSVVEGEISCFLETSQSDNIYAYVWKSGSTATEYAGAWPGSAMTLVGKADNGNNIYKWTYTGTSTDIPSNVIFTHGGVKFVDKDIDFTNHGYYVDGVYSTTIEPETTTPVYVYFYNSSNWDNVYCYLYKGTTGYEEWPGVKMTLDNSITYDGKTGWYTVEVPAGYKSASYVVNNGKSGVSMEGKTIYQMGSTSYFEDGTTTNINTVTPTTVTAEGTWYTIAGTRVNRPVKSGVYVHNGKKVVITK